MLINRILLSYLFVYSTLYAAVSSAVLSNKNNTSDSRIRVGFVFAGSARSFITPFVRTTIKENAIAAFCPQKSCIPDIFVRVSSNDNNHYGMSSKGNLTVAKPELKNQIDESLKSIQPSLESGGKLFRIFSEIGSDNELLEMKEFRKDSLIHKIYRYEDIFHFDYSLSSLFNIE